MTGPRRHVSYETVSDMECYVADVRRWGEVLHSMGQSDHVDPEACSVIARSLLGLGASLQTQWDHAFDLVRDNP